MNKVSFYICLLLSILVAACEQQLVAQDCEIRTFWEIAQDVAEHGGVEAEDLMTVLQMPEVKLVEKRFGSINSALGRFVQHPEKISDCRLQALQAEERAASVQLTRFFEEQCALQRYIREGGSDGQRNRAAHEAAIALIMIVRHTDVLEKGSGYIKY